MLGGWPSRATTIGDTPGPPPVDFDRLGAWRDQIGPDYRTARLGSWTILGLDAQLFDSDQVAEKEQWAWLEDQVSVQAAQSPVAVVLHKPLSAPEVELAAAPRYRFVSPPARRQLDQLLDRCSCPLVISGHVHQYRNLEQRGRRHVWAPTSWAVLPEDRQASIGIKRCGILSLWLDDEGTFRVDLVEPPGLQQLTLGVDLSNPYGGGP
jgi:hypothetical protein